MIIRCSSLPLLMACEQSANVPEGTPVFDHDNEAGREGTATHAALREFFLLGSANLTNVCAALDVSKDAVAPLFYRAQKILEEMRLGAPTIVEASLASSQLTGHPDAEWDTTHYRIGDWKTSRKDGNYFHQLMGYASLRRAEIAAHGGSCILFAAWLRDGSVEQYQVTHEEIIAWGEQLEEIDPPNANYVTGDHCTYCPRVSECPAQREDLQRALMVLEPQFATVDVSTMDGATIANVHRKLRLLVYMKDSWDYAIKNRIRQTGPIDCGDGHSLSVVEEPGRRKVDALRAWPVLSDKLTDEELAACVTIGVTAIGEAVAAKAPFGGGAAAKRNLFAALDSVGAVTQGTVEKLKEVRTQNLIGGSDK